jgi:SNF2 family DNA or RNA helicase
VIFTPRPYQPIMRDHILNYPRCALHVEMGLGKTTSVLWALSDLQFVEEVHALVLAPLRVARSVWTEEAKKWDQFSHLKIVPILGDAKDRLAALREPADIHTINYENIPWLSEQVGDRWPWTTIVADEATRLKHFRLSGGRKSTSTKVKVSKNRTTRARTLGKYALKKATRFIELTGTSVPNGLQDLWGQLWFLDFGERLGRTFTAFKNRWFYYESRWSYEMKMAPGAQEEIQKRISDICISLRAEDWFDLKKPIVVDVPVDLPSDAMNMYRQMEKMMYLEINNLEIEAFNAAAKSLKCLQLANGAIYTDDAQNWQSVHDVKLDALESIIEEASGMPVLVAYHFKSDLTRLKVRFPKGRDLKTKKDEDDWNAGKIPVLFAHPASAGHGLNLQHGGNIIVYFGHWWDLEQYQQILERIGPVRQMQSGYNRPVYVYNIRARNTVDDLVIQSRESKRKVQDILMEALRKM